MYINTYLYIYNYIYMSTPYASRCYSCTSLMLLQLRKLDAAPCAECHIALQPHSMLFSGSSAMLCGVSSAGVFTAS